MDRGGFKAEVISTTKIGQVHFTFNGNHESLIEYFPQLKQKMFDGIKDITQNMESRGGGVLDIELLDFTSMEPDYFQLKVTFETCDSMGANFINSVLEELSIILKSDIQKCDFVDTSKEKIEVIMSILSNYTPDCMVKSEVACNIEDIGFVEGGFSPEEFAKRFVLAVNIANIDVHRATTHNKGVLNGIDAVVIATGNDFRAVEACVHTYAARSGQYKSLTEAETP